MLTKYDIGRNNLKLMADYLLDIPEDCPLTFSMETFRSDNGGIITLKKLFNGECGSVGCVIGHAPFLFPIEEDDFGWFNYSLRVFDLDGSAWDWCFSSFWSEFDNTSKGAALRILYFLEKGLPQTFNVDTRISDKFVCEYTNS